MNPETGRFHGVASEFDMMPQQPRKNTSEITWMEKSRLESPAEPDTKPRRSGKREQNRNRAAHNMINFRVGELIQIENDVFVVHCCKKRGRLVLQAVNKGFNPDRIKIGMICGIKGHAFKAVNCKKKGRLVLKTIPI